MANTHKRRRSSATLEILFEKLLKGKPDLSLAPALAPKLQDWPVFRNRTRRPAR